MKKVYSFTQSVMNGTVTMETSVALFATRELAEQTLADIKADNAKRDLGGMRVRYGKVQETDVYENKEEIPFYQFKGLGDMKQTEEIKAMIRGMMDQEMENFKEAVSNGEADETASPVVYTMLQVLMSKIEAMPKVWHSIDEKADSSKFVVLYDVNGGYMSPPSRCMFGFDSMFINAMNKKHGANYTMWAYKDDLVPNKEED